MTSEPHDRPDHDQPVHDQPAGPVGWRSSEERVGAALARTATWSLRLLLVAAALVVVALVIDALWVVVLPTLLGLLLSCILWPPVRFLRRHSVPGALGALGVLLTAVLLLVGLGALLAPQVVDQAQELADQVTAGLEDVQDLIAGPPLNLGGDQLGGAVDSVIASLQDNAQTIASNVLSGAAAAGSLLVTGLLALVLCFFQLKDGPRFAPWIAGLVGRRAAPHVTAIGERAWATLSGFIWAQAAVGLVDAVFIGIGLLVLGVPLALPLAVLVFFGAFVPIIGAFLTGALAVLVALVSDGLTTALIVLAIVVLVQQLEGNVLQPILVGRSLDLHPAVVILAVTAGGTIAGVVGAFLAVPVVAVAAVVVRYARRQLAEASAGPAQAVGQPGGPAEPAS